MVLRARARPSTTQCSPARARNRAPYRARACHWQPHRRQMLQAESCPPEQSSRLFHDVSFLMGQRLARSATVWLSASRRASTPASSAGAGRRRFPGSGAAPGRGRWGGRRPAGRPPTRSLVRRVTPPAPSASCSAASRAAAQAWPASPSSRVAGHAPSRVAAAAGFPARSAAAGRWLQRCQRQRAGAAFTGAAGGGVDKVAVGNHHGQRVALAPGWPGLRAALAGGSDGVAGSDQTWFQALCRVSQSGAWVWWGAGARGAQKSNLKTHAAQPGRHALRGFGAGFQQYANE